ncbi:hypothetical protein JZO66_07890 [Enterococcus sp. DIV0242_7C1]|uniref:Uncharacterized protein n=1 Tax=Candidatus Enterococcus dunnyi TaxID=1834192 RepID=A0A200JCE8_9ENTE|nr:MULTISPECIES: hypothetical protein [unclassified Enterococcus]MBO0470464.1 hypothetical protein [Enterococcus sp. DIV0242_7C1]OUZ34883.1 hypothetical protein A5889_000358 [Enterococcus sp. 9D6_DIV0238]
MTINKFDDTKLYELLGRADIQEIDNFLEKYGINSVDRDGRTFLLSTIVKGEKN